MTSSPAPAQPHSSTMEQVFESVARYFAVLGEPTRLRILHTVCQEEKCVNDIIRATGMAQANVSRHLGLMYQAGMLSRRREGTQVFYRVSDRMFVELCRSVTVQVVSKLDELTRANLIESDSFPTGPGGSLPLFSPANHKEKASV